MKYAANKLQLIKTKRIVTAFLILTSLFTFATPLQTALAHVGVTITFNGAAYSMEDTPLITVHDEAANMSPLLSETVQVTVTSPLAPNGITILLNETGINTHIFENNALVLTNATGGLPLNTNVTISISNFTLNTNPNTIQTVNIRLRSFAIDQTLHGEINPYTLQETSVNSGVFSRTINFTSVTSEPTNKLRALPSDVIVTENLDNNEGLNYFITPTSEMFVAGIAAAIGHTLVASYPGAVSDTADILDLSRARPILTLDVAQTPSANGGRDRFPPSFTLSKSSITALSLPDNVLSTILEADPFTPIMSLNDPSIDYPLSINDNGFILSQFANTIDTQTTKTGELSQLKIILSDPSGIGHLALYTNVPGSDGEIHFSDTYVIYNKGKPIEITDPHHLFYDVKLTESKEGMKYEFLYNITFAKPMDTSDIIIRAWDEKRNSADTKIFDAIKVVGEPIVDPRVANLDLLATTDIIIPYYKFPQYTTFNSDSDGNLIYHNSFGGMEQKQVHPYHEPASYPDSVSKLERHDVKQLYDTIAHEQKKAQELMISKFNLDTSQTFVPNDEVKPYDETRRANEFDRCGKSVGCGLERENNDLMQELCWQEHLRAEKTLKFMTRTNYQND